MAQTIIVDISTRGANPVAYTHQGDTGRTFFAEIYENGEAFAVAGYTIKVGAILPADRGYYVIAGNDMVTATKTNDNTTNKIYFTLSDKYSLKAGNGILTLIFTSNTGTPSTIRPINIDLRIQKSADADDTIAGASDFPEGLEAIAEEVFQEYLSTYLPPVAPSASAAANKAADAKLTGQELDNLKSDIDYLGETGNIAVSHDITWKNGYVGATGVINSSSQSGFAIVPLDAGETVTIGTKNTNITIIGTTTESSLSVGDTVTPVKITTNVDSFQTYDYTATEPINVVLCVRLSDYTVSFSKKSNLALKSEIPDIDPLVEQLYGEDTVLYATYKDAWDKGFLNANGGVTATTAWRTCDYIEVAADSTITYKLSMYTGVYYIAFYDGNKEYLSNSAIQSTVTNNWKNKYTTGTAVIPNGARYVKFSFRADNDTLYNDQSVTINYARISALEDNVSALGNKEKITARVLIIGDSYSANSDKWIAPMMEEFSDDSSYISLAVSSATVKDQSNDRTTYQYTSRPVYSNTTPNTNTFGCQIAKLKRLMTGTDLDTGETAIYQSESEYPNIIIIQGGENDWKDSNTSNYIAQYEVAVENVYYSRWGNVSQGTVYIKPDVETVDRTTFAGAYRYLMDELYTMFPKAQYFFTTTSPVSPHQNPVVSLRRDVAEQQRFCANLNCVSVIDWQAESQMSIIVNSVSSGDGTQANPYVVTPTTQDSTDGLHPTEYGGKKLGKLAAHIINSRFMGLA